jgi:hypothetical protein
MWCGEPTNEIALVGKLPKDAAAPKYSVISYEPCDKCKELWSKGVALIEVTLNQIDGRPPFAKNELGEEAYPTGRFIVLTTEGVKHFFNKDMEAGKLMAVDEEVYRHLEKIFNESSKEADLNEDTE